MNTRFLGAFAACAVVCVTLVGTANYFTDPYGFYRRFVTAGFNQQKEGVRNKIRYVKALELSLRKPATLIMGSSRVHDAMNPDHPLLREYPPVYNLGLDMCRIREILRYLQHAIKNAEVKRVIIGLDFFMFNSLQKVNHDFDDELVGRTIVASDFLVTSVFSKDALLDSIRTIRSSSQQPARQEFLGNGFRPGTDVFFGLKNYPSMHYITNWTFLTSTPQQTKYYAKMKLDEVVFADFADILKLCADRGIDLYLYISPAHAHLDGEGVRASGNWGMLEEWKRRLTRIAAERNVELWDFSGYNSITTERVKTPMLNYWDSSHFTEHVSDLILKRMFAKGAGVPSDFGVLLTPRNIEQHLHDVRVARSRYAIDNNEEVERLAAQYREALAGGRLDALQASGAF